MNICSKCCLRIEKLSVVSGERTILKNIDLHTHCGELVAVTGPNGGGKTTLMRAIMNEIRYSGKIHFINVHRGGSKKLVVGYTPQRVYIEKDNPATVLDLFLAKVSKYPFCFIKTKADREKVCKLLAVVKAEQLIDYKLGNLSGGEIQRVLLAFALYPIPNLLLLDEPVTGIDKDGVRTFYKLVSNLREMFDLSIIIVTHDEEAVASFADKFIFLNKTILFEGAYIDFKKYCSNGAEINNAILV